MLILTAFIWGTAFVGQNVAMEHIGPFTFNGVRMLLAGFALVVCVIISERGRQKSGEAPMQPLEKKAYNRTTLFGGIACGTALFVASTFQQFGVKYTTAGKAGFITALYIVIVPIFGIFLKKKINKIVWLCVAIAVAGLYLLCIKDGFKIGLGDGLVLLCALFFSVHILVIDHFSPKADCIKMSCIQFFICAVLNLIIMPFFENPTFSSILQAWLPILFVGLLSGGMGYTLQIIAQKDTDPAVASLILSLESVFAVLAGAVLLHEVLSVREIIGCVLMFAATIFAQLPQKSLSRE